MNRKQESSYALRAVSSSLSILKSKLHTLNIKTKETNRDLVTEYDHNIEKNLRSVLGVSSYKLIAEETFTGDVLPRNTVFWAIDPIDGTVNFVNGLTSFGISVGLINIKDKNLIEFYSGSVAIPNTKDLYFTASKNKSFVNGKQLRSKNASLRNSLVAVCFSSVEKNVETRNRQYQFFGHLNDSTRGVIRMGSAAVQICLTAENKIQVTYGLGCHIWDVAGGLAIAKNAGARVYCQFIEGSTNINFIVGAATAADELREMLNQEHLCQL